MIEVHPLERSRSRRIVWLLEELGADYRVTRYLARVRERPAHGRAVAVDAAAGG